MLDTYHIYADESAHLENDGLTHMVLGAVWCEKTVARRAARQIRALRTRHGIHRLAELKWTRVSNSKLDYFKQLVDLFWDTEGLNFRAMVVDKRQLDHKSFGQTHDDWYYKIYFDMLKWILYPDRAFRVFLDEKDTRGVPKTRKLHEVLCNSHQDFNRDIIKTVETVRSSDVVLVQLADFLSGALGYANRHPGSTGAKAEVVDHLRALSGYSLKQSTLLRARKFNILHWEGGRGRAGWTAGC